MDVSALTLLVVEDQDFQRRMELKLLRGLGARSLLEAADGREAMELLRSGRVPVDIVFCDLDMPRMDGIEFLRHVAEQRLATAVVVVSGLEPSILNSVETMARAYGLQVLGTIGKPISGQAISDCLARYRATDRPGQAPSEGSGFTVEQLRQGLADREFLPFFQPKVSMDTGEVVGVETLVRWFQPGNGVLNPMAFIPTMELEGLVVPLTEALVQQACSYLLAWPSRGLNLTASLNVSMLCFTDISLADRLGDLVRAEECDPRQIILELTETEILGEEAKVLNVLARLRLKGFKLSIDDFGTGYSSLQQLGHLPFTELKIDQSFVKDAPDQPRHRTMIETSLGLAKRLNLQTVAEGIETRAEWDLLKSLGCEQAQGFFIGRPMPGHLVPDWTQMWQAPEVMAPH